MIIKYVHKVVLSFREKKVSVINQICILNYYLNEIAHFHILIFCLKRKYIVTVNLSVKIVYALSPFNSLTADNSDVSFESTCQLHVIFAPSHISNKNK